MSELQQTKGIAVGRETSTVVNRVKFYDSAFSEHEQRRAYAYHCYHCYATFIENDNPLHFVKNCRMCGKPLTLECEVNGDTNG